MSKIIFPLSKEYKSELEPKQAQSRPLDDSSLGRVAPLQKEIGQAMNLLMQVRQQIQQFQNPTPRELEALKLLQQAEAALTQAINIPPK